MPQMPKKTTKKRQNRIDKLNGRKVKKPNPFPKKKKIKTQNV